MRRVLLSVACLLPLLAGTWPSRLAAHDLPPEVLVQAYVKPEGMRLHVLLRVPLRAMGDIDYPTRGPAGLVDLARVDRALRDAVALWIVPGFRVFEDGRPLAPPALRSVRVTLPGDRSFEDYDEALSHLTGPPPDPATTLEWNQGLMDAGLDFAITSDRAALTIEPLFARLGVRVVTALQFLPPDGGVRAFEFTGDPGPVPLDPALLQALWRFVRMGFTHILEGADHLLFLVCLVIPVRRLRTLVPVVTAFAVAHSITLIGSAAGLAPGGLWFPALVETLIAGSIVYMAIENILRDRFDHRWTVAFLFGLVHGFGFAFRLRDTLQFAGTHLVTSLVSFNVGIEAGQILVLAVIVPPLAWMVRAARSERIAVVVLSALVAHTAWHWMIDRGAALGQYRMAWPTMDAAFAAAATGWLLLAAIAALAWWGIAAATRAFAASGPTSRPPLPRSEP